MFPVCAWPLAMHLAPNFGFCSCRCPGRGRMGIGGRGRMGNGGGDGSLEEALCSSADGETKIHV